MQAGDYFGGRGFRVPEKVCKCVVGWLFETLSHVRSDGIVRITDLLPQLAVSPYGWSLENSMYCAPEIHGLLKYGQFVDFVSHADSRRTSHAALDVDATCGAFDPGLGIPDSGLGI